MSVVYGVSWFINFARALCAREVQTYICELVILKMRFFGMGAKSPKYRTSCRNMQLIVNWLFKLYNRNFLNRFCRPELKKICSHAEIGLQHLDNESIITTAVRKPI